MTSPPAPFSRTLHSPESSSGTPVHLGPTGTRYATSASKGQAFGHLTAVVLSVGLLLGLACASPAQADDLSNGLGLLSNGYLFDDQLDGSKLLGKALNFAALRVPELQARQDQFDAWILETDQCQLRLESGQEIAQVLDLLEPLDAVVRLLEECVLDFPEKELPPSALVLQGVLSGLDPYSTVLDGRGGTEHTIQYRGKLAGIGARIGTRDEQLTLISVYRDSPAYGAGLRDDDVVLRIDELSAANILVSDAVDRIRGKEGSDVKLLIDRKGFKEPQLFTVTRGVVRIPSVTSFILERDVLYAEITHFSQTTPGDFHDQVKDLLEQTPKARGVVIDLRRNSGGSMLGSSAIGDFFLERGVLIRTSGRDGRPTPGLTGEVLAGEPTPFAHLPVAFLSSGGTASGSELLAASLRNNDRAIVIGERSYGKGTVQKTFNLGAESTLKMTVGHFLPNGIPIPGGGLIPNVEMKIFHEQEERVRIPFEKATSDLPFWLRYPAWAGEAPSRATVVIDVAEEAPEAAEDEATSGGEDGKQPKDTVHLQSRTDDPKPDLTKDPTLALAVELVGRFGDTSAGEMMQAAAEFLDERAAESDRELVAFFARHQIDWSPPPQNQTIQSEQERATLTENLSTTVITNGRASAGDESELSITIHNSGKHDLHRVRGIASTTSGALSRSGIPFGKIPAGGSVTQMLPLSVPKNTYTGRIGITLQLYDDDGELGLLGPAAITIEGGAKPRLALRTTRSSDDNEDFDLRVEIANRGDAPVENVRGRLENPLSGEFEIVEGNALIEKLEAGETTTLDFRIKTGPKADLNTALKLLVGEVVYGNVLEPTIPLFQGPESSGWLEAPQIRVLGTRRLNGGGEEVIFEVLDESGIAQAWLRADEEKADSIQVEHGRTPRAILRAPWNPETGITDYAVRAENRAGLSAFLRVGL